MFHIKYLKINGKKTEFIFENHPNLHIKEEKHATPLSSCDGSKQHGHFGTITSEKTNLILLASKKSPRTILLRH